MTKPIPDKAEVVLEYPDKFYSGTFERSSRFDAHVDATGILLVLDRPGDADARKSVHMHIHYALFADILRELAKTVSAIRRMTPTGTRCATAQKRSTRRSPPMPTTSPR